MTNWLLHVNALPVCEAVIKIDVVSMCGLAPMNRLTALLFLQYEPELFPGLIYRMKQPKIVLLIFVSGKVVLTGKPSLSLRRA